MVTCLSRSELIVNDDTPTSYFLLSTPGMIEPNLAFWNSALTPNLVATAVNRSTSNPTIFVPSANSLGA